MNKINIKYLAASGAILAGMGLGALGLGTGLAHASVDAGTPNQTQQATQAGPVFPRDHPIPDQKGLTAAAAGPSTEKWETINSSFEEAQRVGDASPAATLRKNTATPDGVGSDSRATHPG